MKDDKLDEHKLDAIVAEKIMGWKWRTHVGINVLHHPAVALAMEQEDPRGVLSKPGKLGNKDCWIDGIFFIDTSRKPMEIYPDFPHYTTSMTDAWVVVEHVIHKYPGHQPVMVWRSFESTSPYGHSGYSARIGARRGHIAWAVLAPKALCLAALALVEFELQKKKEKVNES